MEKTMRIPTLRSLAALLPVLALALPPAATA